MWVRGKSELQLHLDSTCVTASFVTVTTMLQSESGPFPARVELLRIHVVLVHLISILLHFFPSQTHHDSSMLPAQ